MKQLSEILTLFTDLPFAVDGVARFRKDKLSVYLEGGEYRIVDLENTPAYIRQTGVKKFEEVSIDCDTINKVTTTLALVCRNMKYTIESLENILVYYLTVNDFTNLDRIKIQSVETDKDTILKDEKLPEMEGDFVKITFDFWFYQSNNSCEQPTLECIC